MKGIVISIYVALLSKYKRLRYFFIPNLFSNVNFIYENVPNCQQRLEVTGKGKVKLGTNCGFGYRLGGFWRNGYVELQARFINSNLFIGNNVYTNNNIFICAANNIIIESFTRIGQNVTIMDFEAHGTSPEERNQIGEIGEVLIGENVWIGNNVIILKNTKIGKNTIIAAGAIVSGIFPENVLIGGVPAKVIKEL